MLELLRIAPLSTVQDGGRPEWRALGVPASGPLDDWSHAIANILVGNRRDCAALEIGFGRSELLFEQPTLIAVTGARAPIEAAAQALPRWRPILLAAGTRVSIEPARQGQRSYLAVAGGLRTPEVLRSRSGAPQAGLGLEALKRGDRLACMHASPLQARAFGAPAHAHRPIAANWWADAEPLLDLEGGVELRLIAGAHIGLLGDRYSPYTQTFKISHDANRMAAPLLGTPLAIDDGSRLISEPVVPGTVQLPPAGQPVVLLADAQTIGGYPRIGHLASVDLARFAQRRSGSELRFEPIGVEASRRLWLWRLQRLARLELAVKARLR